MRAILTAVVTVLVVVSRLQSQTAGRAVDLRAADGTLLRATHFPAEKPGPAVILLHMCDGQRRVWDTLGTMLAARGIHVIAPDYRGYGESGGRRSDDLPRREQQRVALEIWPRDLDVVYDYLMAQPGVDRTLVGAAGGSCGGGNAVELAKRHPEVRTLVLLAGGFGAGPEFLPRVPWMPVLGVAARDDRDAVKQMRGLLELSKNPKTRFVEYQRGGHGTDLFRVHRDLEPLIADWFVEHLITKPVVQGFLPASASLRSKLPWLSTKNTQSEAWSHLVMWR